MRRPSSFRRTVAALVLAAIVLAPVAPLVPPAEASNEYQRAPALYMGADLLVARPVLLAITLVGTAFYFVSLPFTLLGGNEAEAADVLVVGPARATFARCLGCTGSERE